MASKLRRGAVTVKLARLALREPERMDPDDEHCRWYICQRCRVDYYIPWDLDPSTLCNGCAHDVATLLASTVVAQHADRPSRLLPLE